jgi:formate dehydrogenase subunit gamma
MPDEGIMGVGRSGKGDDDGALGSAIDAICLRHGHRPANLIEILHDVQHELGYVPTAALPILAKALNITRAEVQGVVSFYHDFRRTPGGRVTVKLCRAEACQSVGALALIDEICARHGIALGETSPAGVTVEPVYCLGNCALGPAALVDDRLVGRVTPERLDAVLADALEPV